MGFGQWKRKEQRYQRSQRKDGGLSKRPPPSPGNSFDSVPKWERRFIAQMSWRDFCDKKQAIHLYSNVLNWDDSAGKVAFDSSKARYWAKTDGLPCNTPLPDPDTYIDEIDYDAPIDPRLIDDLHKMPPPPPPPCEKIPDISSIKPTGWDVVDPSPSDNIPEYIFAIPSSPNDTARNAAPYRQVDISTTDEAATEMNNAGDLQESESSAALNTNRGSQHDRRNDDVVASEKISLSEHQGGAFWRWRGGEGSFGSTYTHQRCNERVYGRGSPQDRRNDDIVASEKVSLSEHQSGAFRRRRGGEGSFGSTYMHQRCNERVYGIDVWRKYAKEQYFWHQASLDRGLSCAPYNY